MVGMGEDAADMIVTQKLGVGSEPSHVVRAIFLERGAMRRATGDGREGTGRTVSKSYDYLAFKTIFGTLAFTRSATPDGEKDDLSTHRIAQVGGSM